MALGTGQGWGRSAVGREAGQLLGKGPVRYGRSSRGAQGARHAPAARGLGIASGTWGEGDRHRGGQAGRVIPPCRAPPGFSRCPPTRYPPHPHVAPLISTSLPASHSLSAPQKLCCQPDPFPPASLLSASPHHVLRTSRRAHERAQLLALGLLPASWPFPFYLYPFSSLTQVQHACSTLAPTPGHSWTPRPLPEPRNGKGLSRRSLSVSGCSGAWAPALPGVEQTGSAGSREGREDRHRSDRLLRLPGGSGLGDP